MKSKKMIIGMAVTLFCLVFVGAFLAQGYETEGSELRCAVERNVVPYSFQLFPNANNEAMATLTSEDSLEDLENAYYYQMIEDNLNIKDGQMMVAPTSKTNQDERKKH